MAILQGNASGTRPQVSADGALPITALPKRSNPQAVGLAATDVNTLDLQTRMYYLLLDIRRELLIGNELLFPTVNFDNERAQFDRPPYDGVDPYLSDDSV
jgi:hypothetical protein